ncbi:Fungal hydrophobin [Microdochium nivale]|nr:Fungal hydrophobin [Microdochium nivale]
MLPKSGALVLALAAILGSAAAKPCNKSPMTTYKAGGYPTYPALTLSSSTSLSESASSSTLSSSTTTSSTITSSTTTSSTTTSSLTTSSSTTSTSEVVTTPTPTPQTCSTDGDCTTPGLGSCVDGVCGSQPPYDACSGLYDSDQCCSTDVLGIADLDCSAPQVALTSPAQFDNVCASVGRRARCCVVPILGQAVLCRTPSGL